MEHEVDRSGVQAQQCAQLADTNRPEAWSRREEGCPVGAEWLVFGFEGMAFIMVMKNEIDRQVGFFFLLYCLKMRYML